MVIAHAITIALSKNKAQSAKSSAAPASDFDVAKGGFMRSIVNMVFFAVE
jgi:hypothetical protein